MDTPLVNVNYLGAQAVTYCRQMAHRNAETLRLRSRGQYYHHPWQHSHVTADYTQYVGKAQRWRRQFIRLVIRYFVFTSWVRAFQFASCIWSKWVFGALVSWGLR
jgi:hypothetical protein